MSHYTEGRRWSHILNAWIFADQWNDKEEIARLEAERDATLARIAELERENAALQARIDELMLEFCPKDMTQQQLNTWGEYQTPISSEEAERIHAAIYSEKENERG